MSKSKNPYTDSEIASIYKEKVSAYAVAKQLKIGVTTVYRSLYRSGIVANGINHYRYGAERYSREIQEEIRKLYDKGMSVPKLKQKFGGSQSSLYQAIRRVGGTIRPLQGQKSKITPDQELALCAMYKNGMSKTGMEAILKISQHTVNKILRKYGLPLTRSKYGFDKNGRRLRRDGYIYVNLEDNSPYINMCIQGRNYILEHRLEMAKHLKRLLDPSETVHHIDGNRSNNKIENLELRQGRHGKGVVMVCKDCGSKNVIHAPLA